jgi:hypothetical protein
MSAGKSTMNRPLRCAIHPWHPLKGNMDHTLPPQGGNGTINTIFIIWTDKHRFPWAQVWPGKQRCPLILGYPLTSPWDLCLWQVLQTLHATRGAYHALSGFIGAKALKDLILFQRERIKNHCLTDGYSLRGWKAFVRGDSNSMPISNWKWESVLLKASFTWNNYLYLLT